MNSNATPLLDGVLAQIGLHNSVHCKRLTAEFANSDPAFRSETEGFLQRYTSYLKSCGRSLEEATASYLTFVNDVMAESVTFYQTGSYTNSSFEEVNRNVYGNPEVMRYYMEGLLLSQFLWHQHYEMLQFFRTIITEVSPSIRRYLEIGGGHGLIMDAFAQKAQQGCQIDVVDISATSLEMCKKFAQAPVSNYILGDLHVYVPREKYDFITMGEVLEHLENPVAALKCLRTMLAPMGRVFVTTPTNAPAIDHIFLFRDVQHIRDVIHEAGFRVEKEIAISSERTTPERIARLKLSILYGALLAPE